MADFNTSIAGDNTAKASGLASIIAALGNGLNAGGNSKLFASLLSQSDANETAPIAKSGVSLTGTSSVPKTSSTNFSSGLTTADLTALRSIAARLQTLVAQHKAVQSQKSASQQASSAKDATTTAAAAKKTSTTVASGDSGADVTASTPTLAADATTAGDPLQSTLDLIAALQKIVQAMLQKAKGSVTDGGTDNTGTASDTTTSDADGALNGTNLLGDTFARLNGLLAKINPKSPTDVGTTDVTSASSADTLSDTSLDQAMKNILAMLQIFEKQFAHLSDTAAQSSADAQTTLTPEALAQNLNATLVKMIAVLKTDATKNRTTDTDDDTTTAARTDAAATTTSSALAAIPDAKINPATAERKPLNDFDTLFRGMDDLHGYAAPASPTLAATAVTAEGKNATAAITADANTVANGNAADSTSLSGRENLTGASGTSPLNFASQLSSTRITATGSAAFPTAVEQVILKLSQSAKSGDNQLSLQLHPADLGKITVKLDFSDDGKVQGTVVADNASTLDMLHKDARSLERALQDAGLRADPGSLQFSLGNQQQQNNASQQSSTNSGNAASGGDTGTGLASENELADAAADEETYYITPGRVNLKV